MAGSHFAPRLLFTGPSGKVRGPCESWRSGGSGGEGGYRGGLLGGWGISALPLRHVASVSGWGSFTHKKKVLFFSTFFVLFL